MKTHKEELMQKIEQARRQLNESIEGRKDYADIYRCSIEVDKLLEQYIVAGY